MSLVQVLLRPGANPDPLAESGAVFVPERFVWFAALLPPLWALVHGLWIELVIWIAAMALLWGLDLFLGGETTFWLYVLGSIWIGFEASAIRVSALERKQFLRAGDLVSSDEISAEMEWMKRKANV